MLEWAGGGFNPEYFNAQEVSFDDPDERWSIAFGGREGIKLPLLHARNSKEYSVGPEELNVENDIKHGIETQQNLVKTTEPATADTTAEEVYRVWFLRILSQKGVLTKIRRNKISLTKTAKKFLKKDPYDNPRWHSNLPDVILKPNPKNKNCITVEQSNADNRAASF